MADDSGRNEPGAHAVAELLADPTTIEWVPTGELIRGRRIACIDGRGACRAVAAPGGSTGELILLLAVAEWLRGAPYEAAQLDDIVAAHADAVGGLHLHTDAGAVAALAEHLGVAASVVRGWLCEPATPPPIEARARLLDVLAWPEHIGCGHLRALVGGADAYRVRAGLVAGVLRSVHALAWRGGPVSIEVLQGAHTERAVLMFHSREALTDDSLLPNPRGALRTAFFVDSASAIRLARRRSAEHLLAHDTALARVELLALLLEVERLGERHLNLTLSTLAPGLARHRIRFDGDCTLHAEFQGEGG